MPDLIYSSDEVRVSSCVVIMSIFRVLDTICKIILCRKSLRRRLQYPGKHDSSLSSCILLALKFMFSIDTPPYDHDDYITITIRICSMPLILGLLKTCKTISYIHNINYQFNYNYQQVAFENRYKISTQQREDIVVPYALSILANWLPLMTESHLQIVIEFLCHTLHNFETLIRIKKLIFTSDRFSHTLNHTFSTKHKPIVLKMSILITLLINYTQVVTKQKIDITGDELPSEISVGSCVWAAMFDMYLKMMKEKHKNDSIKFKHQRYPYKIEYSKLKSAVYKLGMESGLIEWCVNDMCSLVIARINGINYGNGAYFPDELVYSLASLPSLIYDTEGEPLINNIYINTQFVETICIMLNNISPISRIETTIDRQKIQKFKEKTHGMVTLNIMAVDWRRKLLYYYLSNCVTSWAGLPWPTTSTEGALRNQTIKKLTKCLTIDIVTLLKILVLHRFTDINQKQQLYILTKNCVEWQLLQHHGCDCCIAHNNKDYKQPSLNLLQASRHYDVFMVDIKRAIGTGLKTELLNYEYRNKTGMDQESKDDFKNNNTSDDNDDSDLSVTIMGAMISFNRLCFGRSMIKYPLYRYGFDYFGLSVGYFGVLSFIMNDLCKPQTDNILCLYLWPLYRPREQIREMRVSVLQFANNIDNNFITPLSDELYWKHLSFVMLGKLSFQTTKYCQIFDKKNVLKSNETNLRKNLKTLQNYLKKFVIQYVEPNLTQIIHKYHCNLEYNNDDMTKYCLYSMDGSHRWIPNDIPVYIRDCYVILGTCFEICGFPSKALYYYRLSNYLLQANWSDGQILATKHLASDICKLKQLDSKSTNNSKDIYVRIGQSLDNCLKIVQNFRLNLYKCCKNVSSRTPGPIAQALDCQTNSWIHFVINPKTREDELYLKWKNVTSIKYCNYCEKSDGKLSKCKNCKKVYYCSKLCQKKDWNLKCHRNVCV